MIASNIFQDGIEILENSFSRKVHAGALRMWKELIEEENIQDDDFIQGVKDCCKNEKFLPSIGILIEYSNRVKFDRWNKEERIKKAQHNKDDRDLMDSQKATKIGKRSLILIELMLSGKLSPKEKVDFMIKADEAYPGKGWGHEAVALKNDYEDMGLMER